MTVTDHQDHDHDHDEPCERCERPRRGSWRWAAIVAVVLAGTGAGVPLGLGALADRSSATASDVESVGVNRLGAATLDVEVALDGVETEAAAFRAAAMLPGDTVFGRLQIANRGSLPLRYALTIVSDPSPLTDWLTFDVWTAPADCEAGVGPRSQVIRRNLMLASTTQDIVGDPDIGRQPGDRVLLPDADETLCLAATLALSTPNEMQGVEFGFDLIVAAEHDIDVVPAAAEPSPAREAGT